LPSIIRTAGELSDKGLTLLLVNLGEDRDVVRRAADQRGYGATVLLDDDGDVARAYGIRGTPTTFLVGRDGRVLGVAVGPRPWSGPDGRAVLHEVLGRGEYDRRPAGSHGSP